MQSKQPGKLVIMFWMLRRRIWEIYHRVRFKIRELFHEYILWHFVGEDKWCWVCYRHYQKGDGEDGRPDCPNCDQSW